MVKTYFIFDTNFIYDSTGKVYFGNENELKKFSEHGKIIIPDTVILEREFQIRKYFNEQIKYLKEKGNLLYNWLEPTIKNINIEGKIKELKENIPITYKTIKISDTNVLYRIRDFGINREPPFEDFKGNSDKGFKDCYILFTVLEFLNKINESDIVFFITGDGKLKEGICKHCNIKVVSNFSEYSSLVSGKLINLIRHYYNNPDIEINDIRTNNKGNLVVSININNNENRLIIQRNGLDTYEIIGKFDITKLFNDYSLGEIVDKLCDSTNFSQTHVWISVLKDFFDLLNRNEATKLLNSFQDNTQINRIIEDDDVSDFAWNLFLLGRSALNGEQIDKIMEMLPLPF